MSECPASHSVQSPSGIAFFRIEIKLKTFIVHNYVKQDSFVIIPPTYSCFILQVKKILLKVYTIHQYINLIASSKSIL